MPNLGRPEDHPLISKAHSLIETLYMKRNKVHEATERADPWLRGLEIVGDCWLSGEKMGLLLVGL